MKSLSVHYCYCQLPSVLAQHYKLVGTQLFDISRYVEPNGKKRLGNQIISYTIANLDTIFLNSTTRKLIFLITDCKVK